MKKNHKEWFYKIRQKLQSNKQLLLVNCDSGYWKMKYLCKTALRNYQICLFELRGADVARTVGVRSCLSSCNNFSFLHEVALEIKFRKFFWIAIISIIIGLLCSWLFSNFEFRLSCFCKGKRWKNWHHLQHLTAFFIISIWNQRDITRGRHGTFHTHENISGDCWWGDSWLN